MGRTSQNTYTFEYGGAPRAINSETFLHSLLSITSIIQEVNREIGTGKPLDINIKALKPGSFLVSIEVLGFIEAIRSLITAENLKTVGELMGAVVSLFEIRKLLSNTQDPPKISQHGGDVIIKASDGSTITVNHNVFQIGENNAKIINSIDSNFEALERDENITDFKIRDSKKKPLFVAKREEFPKLISPEKVHKADEEGPPKKSIIVPATLVVLRPSFDPEWEWGVVYRGRRTSVKLADDVYLSKVKRREEVFGAGDILEVDLQINQTYEPSAKVYIDKSYKIVKVHSHKRGDEQTVLFEKDEPIQLIEGRPVEESNREASSGLSDVIYEGFQHDEDVDKDDDYYMEEEEREYD